MKNRGAVLLLSFLTLAAQTKNMSAQAAALQVQVYDYTELSPAVLHDFVTRTQTILARAGVLLEVDICERASATPCESHRGSYRQVVLRIVGGPAHAENDKRWQHLGQSFAGHDGGMYATIFLQTAKEQAAGANLAGLSWPVVLSYAAAHEVGHLLLGDNAHTPAGLMNGHWHSNDFEAMAQNRLHFSTEQTRELTIRYGTGRQVDVGAQNTIALRQ